MTTEYFDYTSTTDPEQVTLPSPVADGTTPVAYHSPGGKGQPPVYGTVTVGTRNRSLITVAGLPVGVVVFVEYEVAQAQPEVGFTYTPFVEFLEWPN